MKIWIYWEKCLLFSQQNNEEFIAMIFYCAQLINEHYQLLTQDED